MSELKLPLTLEMTSHAGCDTLISNEVTHSIHPQPPCRAGCFKGYSGFRLIPRDLSVGPVPYLLHSALSKEITRSLACLWVSFTSPASVGFPGGHHPSPSSSSPLPKLLAPPAQVSCPSCLSCDSQSCPMHPSFFFLWSPTCLPIWPLLLVSRSALVRLACFFLFCFHLPIPHFSLAPGFPIFCVLSVPSHSSCF